jgi:hypothetical protein
VKVCSEVAAKLRLLLGVAGNALHGGGAKQVIRLFAAGMWRGERVTWHVGRAETMQSHTWYYRPSRLGLRKAEAARLAKKLNDAANAGRLVACLTIDGRLAVDAELIRELRAKGTCGRWE